jgi:heptosyltransferase-3
LHPFASQDCKLWPDAQWREHAEQLQNEGAEVIAYGAPLDRPRLQEIFHGLPQPLALVTGALKSFADDVAKLDLMIGLDSFSVHVAARQGVRSVMINACNHPTLWQAPGSVSVSRSGGCSAYPCMNVPVCERGPNRYACIRAVSVEDIRTAVKSAGEMVIR